MIKYVVEGEARRGWKEEVNKGRERRSRATGKAHHPSVQAWQLITQLVNQEGEGRGPPVRRRGARGKGEPEKNEVVRRRETGLTS